jgi:hypothetical protein
MLTVVVRTGDPMTTTTPDFTSEWSCGHGISAGWARVGNSVPPLFMKAIAEHVRRNLLFANDLPDQLTAASPRRSTCRCGRFPISGLRDSQGRFHFSEQRVTRPLRFVIPPNTFCKYVRYEAITRYSALFWLKSLCSLGKPANFRHSASCSKRNG